MLIAMAYADVLEAAATKAECLLAVASTALDDANESMGTNSGTVNGIPCEYIYYGVSDVLQKVRYELREAMNEASRE